MGLSMYVFSVCAAAASLGQLPRCDATRAAASEPAVGGKAGTRRLAAAAQGTLY